MAKSTIPESIPMALRDQVVPDTRGKTAHLETARSEQGPESARAAPLRSRRAAAAGGRRARRLQAGVYEALAETGLHPDWVVGISIGAINAAIIAGSALERRIDKLLGF